MLCTRLTFETYLRS